VTSDLRLALLDGHEFVREVALADQLAARVDRYLLGERGDLPAPLVGHVLKQGDRPEPTRVQRVLLVASTSSRRLYRGAAARGVTARAARRIHINGRGPAPTRPRRSYRARALR